MMERRRPPVRSSTTVAEHSPSSPPAGRGLFIDRSRSALAPASRQLDRLPVVTIMLYLSLHMFVIFWETAVEIAMSEKREPGFDRAVALVLRTGPSPRFVMLAGVVTACLWTARSQPTSSSLAY